MIMTENKAEQYKAAFGRLRTAWLAGDPSGEMSALREEFPELRAELMTAMQRWGDLAVGEPVVGDDMVAKVSRMASESRERLAEHSREAIGAVAAVQREVRRTGFLPWLERAAGLEASAIERETGIPVRFLKAIGDRAPQLPGRADRISAVARACSRPGSIRDRARNRYSRSVSQGDWRSSPPASRQGS